MVQRDDELSLSEQRFAERIRELRDEKGWSQDEFAMRVRNNGQLEYFNQTTVSRIEKAKRPVRMIEAMTMARVFERPVDLLFAPDRGERWLDQGLRTHRSGYEQINVVRREAERLGLLITSAKRDIEGIEAWRKSVDGPLSEPMQRMYDEVMQKLRHFAERDVAQAVTEGITDGIKKVEAMNQRNVERRAKRRQQDGGDQ